MTPPALLRLVACLVAGLLVTQTPPVVPARATTARADRVTERGMAAGAGLVAEPAPLEVSLRSLSPSTIPRRGRITVTGRVTNRTDVTWSNLNAYLLTSTEPITSAEELALANATEATAVVGDRLTGTGLFESLGDLPPGASTDYALSVPRRALGISGGVGVYWLGVHVLGASPEGTDTVADGRARTFVPLMSAQGPRATLGLVVPVKARVRRRVNGRLAGLTAWQDRLSPEGRLGRLMALGETAADVPVSWVLDPAVADAAASVAADNPPRSIAPTVADGTPVAEDGASPGDPSPSAEATRDPTPEDAPQVSAEAQEAAEWLDALRRRSDSQPVLTVPYGDLDVAAAGRAGMVTLYRHALRLGTATAEGLGIASTPVVQPPSGYLPQVTLERIGTEVPVVLSEEAAPAATSSIADTGLGHRLLLSSAAAEEGGPAPTPRFEALALRQRILSEAALRALSGESNGPLVVTTPEYWDPGPDWRDAAFFAGLDVPWLEAVPLLSLLLGAAPQDTAQYDAGLAYPRRQARLELPRRNLLATRELVVTGRVFATLLTLNDAVDDELAKAAMLASSYLARRRPDRAAEDALGTNARIRLLMSRVGVTGPPFVTMSSEEGTFQVTLVNDLPEPVTVGVQAETSSSDLVITSPAPVSLGAGQRASVRLRARASQIGVHSVTVTPVNAAGQPLGSASTFSVRSSQVGFVIWLIMGFGVAVLLLALAIRIYRRLRRRKRTHGPLLGTTR